MTLTTLPAENAAASRSAETVTDSSPVRPAAASPTSGNRKSGRIPLKCLSRICFPASSRPARNACATSSVEPNAKIVRSGSEKIFPEKEPAAARHGCRFVLPFIKLYILSEKPPAKLGEMPVFPRVSRFLRIDIDNSAVFRYNKKSAVRAVNGCVPHFLSNSKLNNFTD